MGNVAAQKQPHLCTGPCSAFSYRGALLMVVKVCDFTSQLLTSWVAPALESLM